MPSKQASRPRGFTVLEVLIAITVSLVLMLSLTRAFKFLADTIRSSRVEVELSTEIQNINQLIQDDIRKMTVELRPQTRTSGDEGYFVYYEGPTTDSTSATIGPQAGQYFSASRFGDFDDYIAFTAYSPDVPFRGVVPAYLLLEKADETDDGPGDTTPNDYDIRGLSGAALAAALEPVVIYSNYAEIIYYLQPEYPTSDSTNGLGGTGPAYAYDDMGNVIQNDVDGNGYPDRLTLHRRVLLIRPDLNLTASPASPVAGGPGIAPGTLPQLSFPTSAGDYVFMQPDPWPFEDTTEPLPQIIRPGGLAGPANRTWQLGMTPIHQQCDLSVRRVLDPSTGLPANFVAANSLADLTQPHNRFAHVRAPDEVLGLPTAYSGYSSMPILAVGSQLATFGAAGAPSYLSAGLVADGNGNVSTTAGFFPDLTVTTPSAGGLQSTFNGFLRPEFALGMDLTHTEVPTAFWGRERLGEDILGNAVLGFDVQAYDQLALVALHPGPDGAPGLAGIDDDANGTTDDASELGVPNTDDLTVSPSDPLFFQIVRLPASSVVPASRGAFVDLAYDRLPGGNVRGFGALKASSAATANSGTVPTAGAGSKLNTQFSAAIQSLPGGPLSVPVNLYSSGKLIRDGSAAIRMFQPTYDTFTQGYEFDGLHQRDASDQLNPEFVGTNRQGTVWMTIDPAFIGQTDLGADGLDTTLAGTQIGNVGVDDPSERETSAPFAAPMSSFRIRLRIEDPGSGQITQQSINSNSDF